MARLGFDVSTLVKLGRDARADFLLSRLSAEGVSGRWVVRDPKAPTGASVIISSHDRNAAVFTFRGANTLLEPTDIHDEALAADLVYVSSLSNRSAECFPHIIKKAKAAGALVAVNAGVRQLSARGGAFLDNLPSIDVLAINRAEADALVPGLVAKFGERETALELVVGDQPPPLLARGLVSGGFAMSLPAFMHALRGLGTRYVMLTDGHGGAFVSADSGVHYCPAAEANVASTAGAGDAMASTFAAFVALGRPSEVALKAATLTAASVVSYIDTQTGLLRRDALEGRLSARSGLQLRKWSL
jgi:ribokinase